MKIFIISTNADEAGAPKHVESIAQGLKDRFQFTLVFGERGPVSERLTQHGMKVHVIKEIRTAISPINDLIAIFKTIKLILHYKPDIIHCHSTKAGMIGRVAALFCQVPWIYTVHGWGWRGLSEIKGKSIIFIERLLKNVPYGNYIFVARKVMNDGIDTLDIDPGISKVIYNGVPKVSISFSPRKVRYTIMMPARVCSAKDHSTLISAFELLNDPDSNLLLCGTGTDTAEFISIAGRLAPKTFSQIEFLGQVSNIQDFYSQSDVFALISNFEALPLSIIEAMSCNKPIIATAVGGTPEIIISGHNGTLVKRKSIDDVLNAFKLYKDPTIRTQHGNNARLVYDSSFSDDLMLNSIANTYNSLLNLPAK